MDIINQIANRMADLGYPQDVYFPEITKISNIIKNSKEKKLGKNMLRNVLEEPMS